jgi:soluble lytic murein transglycosylase-like protein
MSKEQVIARVRDFWPQIVEAVQSNNLRPELLAGLVCQESGGNKYAMRAEPKFRWISDDYAAQRPGGMSSDTELWGRKISWGLCQLMGQVARERGFQGWWPELCEPEVNLALGAGLLAWCIARRGGDVEAGLLRYNGGGFEEYPGQVLAWAEEFEDS